MCSEKNNMKIFKLRNYINYLNFMKNTNHYTYIRKSSLKALKLNNL